MVGFGVFHENKDLIKFGYFHNDELEGFGRHIIRNELTYYGMYQNNQLKGNSLMYIFKSNVFLESFFTSGNRSIDLTKGLGFPLDRIFKLSKEFTNYFPCSFLDTDHYFCSDIISNDRQGKYIGENTGLFN